MKYKIFISLWVLPPCERQTPKVCTVTASMWQSQLCWLTKPNIIVLMYLSEYVCAYTVQGGKEAKYIVQSDIFFR